MSLGTHHSPAGKFHCVEVTRYALWGFALRLGGTGKEYAKPVRTIVRLLWHGEHGAPYSNEGIDNENTHRVDSGNWHGR